MEGGTTASVDAIVIGSGFGGSISACRLAESGRRVLVLERGPRRSGEQFPRYPRSNIKEWLWTSNWNGFWDFRTFPDIFTLTSSGVGGGSHAYANVHLRAPQESFREGWPGGMGPDTLAPYYERVEKMLGVRPFPESIDLPKSRAYAQAARAIGARFFRPNLALYIDDDPEAATSHGEPRYVRDPYNLGVDTVQSPCVHSGECDLGCRFGAKNTVDLNYLAIAEQLHRTTVRPLSEVFGITPENGGYRVHYKDRATFTRTSAWAPTVVVSGGTVNTVELLLRCRDEFGTLPNLSPVLGEHFSGNGDFLCGVANTREPVNPWYGPTITTALEYRGEDYHFYLQEGGFAPQLSYMIAMLEPSGETVRRFITGPVGHLARLRLFYAEIARLANDQRAMAERLPANTMIFLGMGQDASDGRIRLRKRWGRRPKLDIKWDNAATMPMIDRMQAEFRRIALELGGDYVPGPTWRYLRRLITVHPLGGCGLADDASKGVLSPVGEVWNYPNLYVADGSSVPRALGPNPALTIGAIAERIAEHIISA